MKTIQLSKLLVVAFFASFFLSCNNDDDNSLPPVNQSTIAELTTDTQNLSSLLAALQTADLNDGIDLVNTLDNPEGTFTVFAPTNEAFQDLFSRLDGFESLNDFNTPETRALLATILTYHVVATTAFSTDLSDGQNVETVQGENITVAIDGGIFIQDGTLTAAEVVTPDIEATNGVVHIIDKVLLPPSLVAQLRADGIFQESIVELALQNEALSSLVAAIQAADGDLADVLSGEGPFTVFAPTNDAFAAFLGDTPLSQVPTDVLQQILLNHVVSGRFASDDFTSGYINTLSTAGIGDRNLSLLVDVGDEISLNGGLASGIGATVDTPNVNALNGIIHVIDGVLDLPNIVDAAIANQDLTSLVSALTDEGNTTFTDLLGNTDEAFTVLAPTNTAFTDFLDGASLADVDNDVLANVLSNHVIGSSALLSTDLQTSYANTLATNSDADFLSIYINTDSGVSFNGISDVIIADIVTVNGIIHAIDAVLRLPTVVDFALADPTFSTLVTALTFEGQPDFPTILSETDAAPSPFTVFAPTNMAFNDLLSELNISGLGDLTPANLTAVLQYHVAGEANVRAEDLTDNFEVSTLNTGQVFTIGLPVDANPLITDASNRTSEIIFTNVQAINGVIHVIDNVLLPGNLN